MYLMIPWEVMMLRMGLQLRYEDIKYLDSVFMRGIESEGHLLVVLRLRLSWSIFTTVGVMVRAREKTQGSYRGCPSCILQRQGRTETSRLK